MSLFLDSSLSLEKVAYSKLLEKDPTSWPVGIIKEAYNQLPYLKDYEVDVTVDRVDEARGYGVGKILVYPARMEKKAAAKEEKIISFPLVIKDREMSPLDVISYRSSMYPESESKIAQILHRTDTFARSAKAGQFEPVSLASKLNPPTATGQQTRYSGYLGKTASASLTKVALHTFNKRDVESFIDDVDGDPLLRHKYRFDDVLSEYANQFRDWSEKTAQDRWDEFTGSLKPTVVQFTQDGMNYRVKTANHTCFSPKETTVSRYEAQDILSKEAMDRLLQDKILTLATDPVVTERAQIKEASEVSSVGVYTVKIANQDVEGIVIPKMIDFDGNIIGSQLFVGPSQHAMQDKIVGAFVKEASIGGAYPRGKGVFVYQNGGHAVATEPIEITSISTTYLNKEKLASLHAKRLSTGLPVTFTIVPGLQKIASIADQVIALPDYFEFLGIEGRQVTACSDASDFSASERSKTASAHNTKIVSDGSSSYSLRGEAASNFGHSILSRSEAEFALGTLGLTGEQARTIVKTADAKGSASFSSRPVVTEASVKQAFSNKISAVSANEIAPLRVDLTKEASVIVDKETVDSILSLRFMTPENVGIYVDYIPELEKAASKLAEVLVASRLGMDDVKESAAKNAMSQLSAVISGLSGLKDKVV